MTDTKRQSRGISADMNSRAVERRLKAVAELNELCAALGKAQITNVKKPY
jgi:hypothetical protein